jgi:hypothetical protein
MAASAQGIRAGRAYVEVGADDSPLRAKLKEAGERLKKWGDGIEAMGKKLLGIGAAITAPALLAAKSFADTGSQLKDASARTGLFVETLSALGAAATAAGTDLDTVEGGVRHLQKHIFEAANGSVEAVVAFNSLGLSWFKLARMTPDQQVHATAKAINGIRNPTLKAALAMQIFGKEGTELLPVLAGLDASTKEAKQFGLIWSSLDAKNASDFGHALGLMLKVGKRLFEVIGSALAPLLTDVAMAMARSGKTAMDWVNANKPLVVTIFKIGVGVLAAGAAFIALGVAISSAGAILAGTLTVFGAIGTILGVIFSPIGLVIVGLAALAGWFPKVGQAGGAALSWLGDKFGELLKDAQAAFGGIAAALKAGDIALAGKILWLTLKLEWQKGVNFLNKLWQDWGTAAVTVFSDFSFSISRLMTDVWAGMQASFVLAIGIIKNAWTNTAGFLGDTFIKAVGFLQDAWTSFAGTIESVWFATVGSLVKSLNNFSATFAKEWAKIKAIASGRFLDTRELVAEIQKINVETKTKNAAIDAVVAGQQKGVTDQLAQQQKAREAQLAERQGARQADMAGAASGTQSQVDKIEADRLAAQKALDDQQAQVNAARFAGARESVAAGEAKLQALQSELDDAIAQAKAAAGGAAPGKKRPDINLGGLNIAAQKIDTKGTFSAAALRGLGVGDTASEQLKEQQKTNDQLQTLNRRAAQGRLVFQGP